MEQNLQKTYQHFSGFSKDFKITHLSLDQVSHGTKTFHIPMDLVKSGEMVERMTYRSY